MVWRYVQPCGRRRVAKVCCLVCGKLVKEPSNVYLVAISLQSKGKKSDYSKGFLSFLFFFCRRWIVCNSYRSIPFDSWIDNFQNSEEHETQITWNFFALKFFISKFLYITLSRSKFSNSSPIYLIIVLKKEKKL